MFRLETEGRGRLLVRAMKVLFFYGKRLQFRMDGVLASGGGLSRAGHELKWKRSERSIEPNEEKYPG